MTKDELINNLKEIKKDFEVKRIIELREYANSNNPYKVGDVIKDCRTSIAIEKIAVYISCEESQCLYTGIELNKKGEPKIRQINTTIYQSNIIK